MLWDRQEGNFPIIHAQSSIKLMPTRLQILHASDFEAGIPAIDDSIRFSAILNYLRTSTTGPFAAPADALANTLTLSSGDNYLPGPFFNASSDPRLNGVGGLGTSSAPTIGRADIAILNNLGIQASAFGNHEFDLGTRQVADLIRSGSGNPGTNFPYLSSNLDFSTDENLRGLVAANPTTAEASTIRRQIAESTVITLPNGEKVGIVGATTPTLRTISSPGGVTVLPSSPTDYAALAAEIQQTVDVLKGQGINKIVLLSHMQQLNIERDELAPRLRDVDIIIAGGSHTPLLEASDAPRSDGGNPPVQGYPIQRTSASGQPVLVLNTDANYRYVGRLIVEFDDQGVLNLNSLNPVLNGAFATDEAGVDRLYGSDVDPRAVANPNIVAISDGLRTIISSKDSTITGKTEFFLNGTRNDVRTQETNLGNLTADANISYARQIDPTVTLSLKNGGGIRDNIGSVSAAPGATDADDVQKLPPQPNSLAPNKQAGDVSQLDIENSLRFNNGLSLITVTTAQLKQLLEHGVADTAPGATPGRFPQVGGMVFSFNPNLAATEDGNGNGTLDSGEDRNGNGTLDGGQRIRNVALVDEQGRVTSTLVQNGAIVGDANRTFRMVTLNFLAGTTAGSASGGDGYPFPQFVRANPTLANRVDLTGETTADLNGNGVIDAAPTLPAGRFTFAPNGSEQDALAEYLAQVGSFNQQDTDPTQDTRIQNLSVRSDTVLTRGRRFTGTGRANTLRGIAGDDLLLGLGGADRLLGGRGNDELEGGKGNDQLAGGRGRDILKGGLGSDQLTGDQGRDFFVLETGRGSDTIRDYQRADRLQLSEELRFGSLTIEDTEAGTLIRSRNDVLALVRGVSANQITRSDFSSPA